MFVVYRGQDATDAALLRERLLDLGIPCAVRNDLLHGALGELPLSVKPEVFVYQAADVPAARAHVVAFEATMRRRSPGDVICPHCGEENPGNFEVCWQCRQELPSTTTGGE